MEKRKRAMSADNLSTIHKRLATEPDSCRTPPSPPASPEIHISYSAASSPNSQAECRSRSSSTASPNVSDAVVLAGFETCAREAIRFLIEQECLGPTHPIVQQLQQHLEHQKQMLLHQPSALMPVQTSSVANLSPSSAKLSTSEEVPPRQELPYPP